MIKCKYTSKVLMGLIAGLYMYGIGFLVWGKIFGEETMAHAGLWRAQDDPLMFPGMLIAALFQGVMLAVAYCVFKNGICCKGEQLTGVKNGAAFGVTLWLVFGLAGGFFWYTLYPVSQNLLIAFILDKGLSLIGAGAILGALCTKCAAQCSTDGASCSMDGGQEKQAQEKPAAKSGKKSKNGK